MTKKLMLAAGAYPCRWTYRDQVVPGEMRLEGSQTPGGEMFDAPETWVVGERSKSFSPHVDTVDVLRVWLRSGHDAVLLDVRLQHWWPERSWMRAGMALVGSGLPESLLFDSVEFQVGGLTELAGVYPLKGITLPKALDADAVASGTWNAETATQTWTTDDGDELELEFTANLATGPGTASRLPPPRWSRCRARHGRPTSGCAITCVRSRRSRPLRRCVRSSCPG